jgi:hypothetical protein
MRIPIFIVGIFAFKTIFLFGNNIRDRKRFEKIFYFFSIHDYFETRRYLNYKILLYIKDI